MTPLTTMHRLVYEGEGRLAVHAEVDYAGARHEVRVRSSHGPLAVSADALLAFGLVPAMRAASLAAGGDPEGPAGRLRLAGPVSSRLLASARALQDIFHTWYPEQLLRVEVEAEAAAAAPAAAAPAAPRGVGCFFSGGVDSFYSVLKNQEEITHLVFVHGYDVKLADTALRGEASRVLAAAAKELGRTLVEVECDAPKFSAGLVGWGEQYHGSAMAAVALLLSPLLRKVYVPSSHTYDYLFPWGTHPLLDPLWGNGAVEFVHDGAEASRVQKVARIARSDTALRHLRVCYENRGGRFNCGQCEKCLRTMISLRTAGALGRCATFPYDLDLAKVARLDLKHEAVRRLTLGNLKAVERSGRDAEVAAALRVALSGRHHRGWRGVINRARRGYERWQKTGSPWKQPARTAAAANA